METAISFETLVSVKLLTEATVFSLTLTDSPSGAQYSTVSLKLCKTRYVIVEQPEN